MTHLEKYDLLRKLPIDNPKAKPSVLYEGIDSVISGWNDYWKDCDRRLASDICAIMNEDTETYEANRGHHDFTILVNAYNEEIKAIRSFGRHRINAVSFLFRTPYIPLAASVATANAPVSKEELTDRVRIVKETFDKEITTIKEKYQKPIYLVENCDIDNYIGWSLNEDKLLLVHAYKAYNDTFQIFGDNGQGELTKISDISDYMVIPPSEKMAKEMGLELDTQELAFEKKWKHKKLKEKQTMADPSIQDVYDKAICLINAKRLNQYEDNDIADIFFDILERQVAELEQQNVEISFSPTSVLSDLFPAAAMEKFFPTAVMEESLQTLHSNADEIARYVSEIDKLALKKRT